MFSCNPFNWFLHYPTRRSILSVRTILNDPIGDDYGLNSAMWELEVHGVPLRKQSANNHHVSSLFFLFFLGIGPGVQTLTLFSLFLLIPPSIPSSFWFFLMRSRQTWPKVMKVRRVFGRSCNPGNHAIKNVFSFSSRCLFFHWRNFYLSTIFLPRLFGFLSFLSLSFISFL